MSKEELLQFAKEEFKKIFGDRYDESQAVSCVENLINEKGSLEDTEKALKAIITRTASKMENFDYSDKYEVVVYKVSEGDIKPGDEKYDYFIRVGKIKYSPDQSGIEHKTVSKEEKDKVFESLKEKYSKLGKVKKIPSNYWEDFDFKPVITDGKKELVVDDDRLIMDGKVVKKFDPKTTSLMDVVEMAQKILHSDKLKSTFKKFDDLKQALADAPAEIKKNFNTVAKYFDEKSQLNVNFPKWMLKLGEDTYEVESDGSVKINGEKKDWKISLTEPLQKILNIFAVKHNEARLNQNPSLTLHDAMEGLKEMLFDAPTEIKQDFNTLVEYFDSEKKQ